MSSSFLTSEAWWMSGSRAPGGGARAPPMARRFGSRRWCSSNHQINFRVDTQGAARLDLAGAWDRRSAAIFHGKEARNHPCPEVCRRRRLGPDAPPAAPPLRLTARPPLLRATPRPGCASPSPHPPHAPPGAQEGKAWKAVRRGRERKKRERLWWGPLLSRAK
ncbi:unnamed protein product [Urochloa humidicola]